MSGFGGVVYPFSTPPTPPAPNSQITFDNGLTLKWGVVPNVPTNGQTFAYVFTTPFTTGLFSIVASVVRLGPAPSLYSLTLEPQSGAGTLGFSMNISGGSPDGSDLCYVSFIAVGI